MPYQEHVDCVERGEVTLTFPGSAGRCIQSCGKVGQCCVQVISTGPREILVCNVMKLCLQSVSVCERHMTRQCRETCD